MSILKVDTINEKTSGNGVQIAHDLTGPGIAGHVVNYNEGTTTTGVTLNSGSYIDIISTTVTPKFQNSKLKVEWNIFFYYPGSSAAWDAVSTKLFRDSTAIYTDAYALGGGAIYNSYSPYMDYSNQSYFDTPNTTSPITYKIQFASYGGQTLYLQYSSQRSVISVTEIAQ
tara:strand:+ start:85 stop:594 length:510 start_codon:yes stop_codon:yes gene_type:complete